MTNDRARVRKLGVQEPADGADKLRRMPVWAWIEIGAASVIALSIIASFALAAILGSISNEVSQLLEVDSYSSAPGKREATAARA